MELNSFKKGINIIESIERGSIAEELDIEAGDILVSVNGSEVKDIIDYKYMIADDYVEIVIKKPDGELWELEIEKGFDEDLGIGFTNPLIDGAKNCKNKCMFCFIDQLPSGMRETLYFKDDDSRLSFLQGNFITLTNMSEDDIERIIRYRISPINVSVHTTNPDLRVKMLKNKNAGRLYHILKRFAKADLTINCQIVAIPGVNDGEELKRTLLDLKKLHPSVNSLAIVPVGITKYRDNLEALETYNYESSNEIIDLVEAFQRECLDTISTRFAFLSDEFYIVAKRNIPEEEFYEGYPQLENGIGLLRSFKTELEDELDNIDIDYEKRKKYTIATGKLAYNYMKDLVDLVKTKFPNIVIDVVEIENKFFGKDITVSGLLTASDIISVLKDRNIGDALLIPSSMLKRDEDIFLDDIGLDELGDILNVSVIPSKSEGKSFVRIFKD